MITTITKEDADYPALLREIHKPPERLFVRGKMPNPLSPMVAIVGSRQCTPYGRRITQEIATDLASAGIVVVSGLAFGIDAIAHEATLEAKGTTVAVLASPINKITPVEHERLGQQIIDEGGAVISETEDGAVFNKFSFPVRNRIISGMSLVTIVVEAAEKSGSLLTAKAALDEGRDVFAVPGPIDSEVSKGTNNLLRHGAHVLTKAQDVLDLMGIQGLEGLPAKPAPQTETIEEALILKQLSAIPIHLDEIVRACNLPTQKVNSTLTILVMKGIAKEVGGNRYLI